MRSIRLAATVATTLGCALGWTPSAIGGQTPGDPVSVERVEAEALAAGVMQRSPEPLRASPVSPPASLVDSIYEALSALSRFRSPATDSVFEVFGIHAAAAGLHSVVVALDSAAPWLEAWSRGEGATGAPALDSVLQPAGLLSPEEAPWFLGDHAFLLRFREPVLWWAVADRLSTAPFVEGVSPRVIPMGGGEGVFVERGDRGWRFVYSVGWGDCPSGCIHWHRWTFEVEDGGRVSFGGASGEPVPQDRRLIP